MKRTMPIVLFILILLGYGCEQSLDKNPTQPPILKLECTWDREISKDTAEMIFDNWTSKWDPKDNIPNQFFINRKSLEDLVLPKKYCGFRAYYALTNPFDLRSMGLVIAAVNNCHTDQVLNKDDIIWFTDIIEPNTENPKFLPKRISRETAQTYTRNWRNYNQVCLNSDILGNKICDYAEIERSVDPRGNLGIDVVQQIPLGLTFTGRELFDKLNKEDPKATAYVFYNCMYSIAQEGSEPGEIGVFTGFRYDLYIKGWSPNNEGGSAEVDFLKDETGFAVDISGGCPFDCDTMDALQAG